MTKSEREAFLAGVHVAVISVAEDGRGPLTMPVWYAYEPGGTVRFTTGRESRKASLLRSAGRIGFCIQTEDPPYRYVSIEGPIDCRDVDYRADVQAIAERYLGEAGARRYLANSGPDRQSANMTVVLTPDRWLTVDYGKAYG